MSGAQRVNKPHKLDIFIAEVYYYLLYIEMYLFKEREKGV